MAHLRQIAAGCQMYFYSCWFSELASSRSLRENSDGANVFGKVEYHPWAISLRCKIGVLLRDHGGWQQFLEFSQSQPPKPQHNSQQDKMTTTAPAGPALRVLTRLGK